MSRDEQAPPSIGAQQRGVLTERQKFLTWRQSRHRIQTATVPIAYVWLIRSLSVSVPVLAWLLVRHEPPWGDEVHFLETVRLFGAGLSVDLLRTYSEMSGPLTFALYAGWGHLVGFGTSELRFLSAVLASATALLWFEVLRAQLKIVPVLLLAFATVVLNPYFVGLSLFVFTDMLALFSLGIVATGVISARPWVTALGLAAATLTRQYMVFLGLALVVTAIMCRRTQGRGTRLAAPAVAGLIPLGLLILLWGGLAPVNALRDIYTVDGVRFDPHALTLYLVAPAVYLFPLVVLASGSVRFGLLVWVLAVAVFAWMFPVQASLAQVREGHSTVGFFNRAIVAVFPPAAVMASWVLFAGMNSAAMLRALRGLTMMWKQHQVREPEVFFWASMASLIVLMPFSYMPWEKYALPLLMVQSVALAIFIERDRFEPTAVK